MFSSLPLFHCAWLVFLGQPAEATFSIVAVDTHTKEVGSAGATCIRTPGFSLATSSIVIPNKGAINLQSLVDELARKQARKLFRRGETAASVMSKLPRETQEEAEWSPLVDHHQYLAVDINGGSAMHSGPSVHEVVEAVEGNVNSRFFFAIAGNILDGTLGVTQRMKTAFGNAPATASLADRLMAALEGGNMIGADSRCQRDGRAATTAYLRTARPTDDEDQLWVDLAVLTPSKDPIMVVSELYREWKQRNPATTSTTNTTTPVTAGKILSTIEADLTSKISTLAAATKPLTAIETELPGETSTTTGVTILTADDERPGRKDRRRNRNSTTASMTKV
eukprot:GEMP01035749.1.p1 GENE.GEMP01035749.1~~GEMP01035749.1.p1  ORF type:complete len:337 (+),score=75.57 GEMP01035749.1:204-1214(+)